MTGIALALAGCTGTESRSEPTAAPSAVAPEAPTGGSTSQVGSDGAAFLTAYRAGVESLTTVRVHIEINGPGLEVIADSRQRRTPGGMDAVMIYSGEDGFEVRSIDGRVYFAPAGTPAGKFYDVSGEPEFAELAAHQDPFEQLRLFETALESVTVIGEEAVDGVPTTHYEVVLDGSRADLPAETLRLAGPTVTYQFWMDAQGRPLRTSFSIGPAVGTLTISDINEPMDVAAPAPEDLLPLPN